MRKTQITAILSLLIVSLSLSSAAATSKTVKGSQGQTLSVDKTVIRANGKITIMGSNFDPKIGIYLAFCKTPKKGQPPTPCGGGINMSGEALSSIWISNDPPPYGDGLVEPFEKNGSFKVSLRLQPKFDDVNCRKVRCAITVRADHLRSSDRSSDLFVPIKFKK